MKPLGTGSTSSQLNNLNLGWAEEKLEFTRPLQNQNTSQPTNQPTVNAPTPPKKTNTKTKKHVVQKAGKKEKHKNTEEIPFV